MEWIDEGIVLSARPHGETAAIAVLLTAEHGCHAGLVPGGQGHRSQSLLQSGNIVQVRWRARLVDHLGNYTLDPVKPYAAAWLDVPEVLGIIASACAVTEAALPERQPMPGVHAGLEALLSLPEADLWGPSYVKWEVSLLKALGYGLNFTRCAVTGETENLAYVSPRTGHAVTEQAAKPYREKLLTLPSFLMGNGPADTEAVLQGLALTGHFLAHHVFAHSHGRFNATQSVNLPPARQRLVDFYKKSQGVR